MADRSASTNARPFLPLAAGPNNRLRQKVRGGGPKPRESAAVHGRNLIRQVEGFQRTVDEYAARRASDLPDLPPDHQVIIESKRLLPEQARSLGLTPIEERDDGLLVTITPEVSLPTLVGKAQSYVTERTESGNPRYGGVIAPIEQIRPATRNDKAGERLLARLEAAPPNSNELVWIDVELAGGQSDLGAKNRQEFYDYVNTVQPDSTPYGEEAVTAISHFLIETDYSLHRLSLPVRAVLDLLDNSQASWVLAIDLVPEIEDRNTPLSVAAGGDLPPLPSLPDDAPRVVIINSGIAADHPLFRDIEGRTIIGRQQSFLPDTVEPAELTTDEVDQGHGTAVASIVAYGSLRALVLDPDRAERPTFWLENAKIMVPAVKLDPEADSSPQLHPRQFAKALMRQVIEAFHQPLPQHCRIFNLSAGTVPHPTKTISNWSEELDNLSAQHGILFVVAGGNLQPAELAALLSPAGGYPEYLLSPEARLRDPGQAYHAITVGAVTPDPTAAVPRQSGRSLAPLQHPAPFSRSGLLKPGPVKPDVVEVGGNLELRGGELAALPESAVLVASSHYVTGRSDQPLGFQYGTGLAAAKVTHLAGKIQAQYPSASANLIRALIVNSAEWPQAFVRGFTDEPDRALPKEARQTMLRLCGYGVPQEDKALASNRHCMVFIAEDHFSWTREDRNSAGRYPAKVSFFSIRLEPDDLYHLPPATRVRVSVTLAYNPPVRKTQRRRYQAVDMRWALRRQEESEEDFYTKWMREANGEEEDQAAKEPASSPIRPWPWQLKPVLNPGGRVRRGSLIRDWFEGFAHDLPPTFDIVTLAMVAPWRRPPEALSQHFALVVSIEAVDQQLPLYDSVRVQAEG